MGVGSALGMILGGVLIEAGTWRWVFFVNVPVGALLLALVPRVLAETARRPVRFDLAGAAAATRPATALVLAFVRIGEQGRPDGAALAAFAAAAVLLPAFALLERRAREPIMPLWLFTADRARTAAYTVQFLLPAAMFGTLFFLTRHFQDVLGYGAMQAGLAFLPMAGLQFAIVRFVPRLLPRLGTRVLAGTGTLLIAAGLLWLTRLSPGDGYAAALLAPIALLGLGGGLAMMPLNALVLGTVEPAHSGAASGVAQTMMWTGGAVGPAVMLTVQGAATGDGMAPAFATGTALAAAAFAVTLALRGPAPDER
ncbi:hypothetical protein BJF79_37870 [Actinomadura sp. CNU-125]|uniref:MFS transporter n=1 Tax=Actinomadura sp. CNU-125 TaxID=1904961 RepID=UPI00095CE7C1|nr:MFS transporter [Actinomadura sp. CNU-125]OLT30880.1 hypothetical protein BJF79_37870 [Actinomadura sp. CNU-125]